MNASTRLAATVLFLYAGAIQAASAQPPMTTEIDDNSDAAHDELSTETGDPRPNPTPAPLTEPEETEEAAEVEEVPPARVDAMPTKSEVQVQPTRVKRKPVVLMPSKPEAAEKQRQRDRWYIGFAVGGGDGSVKSAGSWKSYPSFVGNNEDSSGYAMDLLEVGGTLTENLLLGGRIAFCAWGTEKAGTSRVVSQGATYASLTWFPLDGGKGFLVRGGLGLAELTDVTDTTTSQGSLKSENKYSGVGSTFGLGYAFWLGESFNLTLNMDIHHALLSGDESKGEPTSGWYGATTLGFMWY